MCACGHTTLTGATGTANRKRENVGQRLRGAPPCAVLRPLYSVAVPHTCHQKETHNAHEPGIVCTARRNRTACVFKASLLKNYPLSERYVERHHNDKTDGKADRAVV